MRMKRSRNSKKRIRVYVALGGLISIIVIFVLYQFTMKNTTSTNDEKDARKETTSLLQRSGSKNISITSANESSSNDFKNETDNSKNSTSESHSVDTKNLTVDQVQKWVSAIWIKRSNINLMTDPRYKIIVENRDGLAYATVVPTGPLDTADEYRINEDGYLEQSGYYAGRYPSSWIVVSKIYLDTSLIISDHDRANEVRRIMHQNQQFDQDILATIPDEVILAANVGNATNSQIAQTAANLLKKYPNLK